MTGLPIGALELGKLKAFSICRSKETVELSAFVHLLLLTFAYFRFHAHLTLDPVNGAGPVASIFVQKVF